MRCDGCGTKIIHLSEHFWFCRTCSRSNVWMSYVIIPVLYFIRKVEQEIELGLLPEMKRWHALNAIARYQSILILGRWMHISVLTVEGILYGQLCAALEFFISLSKLNMKSTLVCYPTYWTPEVGWNQGMIWSKAWKLNGKKLDRTRVRSRWSPYRVICSEKRQLKRWTLWNGNAALKSTGNGRRTPRDLGRT